MSHLHDVWSGGCFLYQAVNTKKEMYIVASSSGDAKKAFKDVTGNDADNVYLVGEVDVVTAEAKARTCITSGST
jgi:hypothetical protein